MNTNDRIVFEIWNQVDIKYKGIISPYIVQKDIDNSIHPGIRIKKPTHPWTQLWDNFHKEESPSVVQVWIKTNKTTFCFIINYPKWEFSQNSVI